MLTRDRILLLLLLLVGAFLLFYNIDNYYFWGDEGTTALYGKNILKYGLPYGFDGRNGYLFAPEYLPLFEPWLALYAAAASIKIFGGTIFGERMLFALLGLLAIFVQYIFVAKYLGNKRLALINIFMMITSVSFLLFARQCRYYSLVLLLLPTTAYFYLRFRNRWWEFLPISLLFILFFFAQYLIAIPSLVALFLSFFFFDNRKKAVSYFLKPLLIVIPVTGVYVWWLSGGGDLSGNSHILQNIYPSDFGRIILLYFKDYNLTQLMPAGIVLILILIWLNEGLFRKGHPSQEQRKMMSVLTMIFIFTVVLSILSPQISAADYSDIRYATAIFPLLILVQAFVIEKTFRWKKAVAIILLGIAVFTNLLTFSPFRSYFSEYIMENAKPFDNSVKMAVRFLEKRIHQNDIILVGPNHMVGTMQYYLGDRLLFCSVTDKNNQHARDEKLPAYMYSEDTVPDWIVLFGLNVDLPNTARLLNKLELSLYKTHSLPMFGPDVSRPEIFWRSFVPITQFPREQGLFILERVKDKNVRK
jgi:4-amino-4-deoxy-L-arabinose transferase and related glycosyltransferases of PMT family